MQDNPAPRSPRVFAERPCPDCGRPFTPRSGRQVRCAECKAGPPAAICGQDGCGTQLRRDNKIGYCEPHKRPTARAPERQCAADDCGRKLRIDNESGYCPDHVRLSQGHRESRERTNARLRSETASRPDTRPFCSVGECEKRLRSDNATGRCPEHHYQPLDLPVCILDGCGNRITAQSASDRCYEHRGKYWAPDAPKCAAPGCGKTLAADNGIGYCRKHRSMSPTRQEYSQAYYRSRADELREYARLYREVYGDEHRASSRRWELANPDRKAVNDAAYRKRNRLILRQRWNAAGYPRNTPAHRAAVGRRRQRVMVNMDALDRALSAGYRAAIRNDPCFYCGSSAERCHVDHYFPLAKGGTDHWFNLVPACRKCNLAKFTTCGTAYLLLTAGMAEAA